MVRGTTEEERQKIIKYFCSICDRYEDPCHHSSHSRPVWRGPTDQERYAMRGWCGWAIVGGRYATINHRDGEELVEFKDAETVKRSDLENTSSE